MKVTLNWLKQYVDFSGSPEELGQHLTMLGLEVEGIHRLAGEFEGVVVAHILASDKHPNADKLSVCRVSDGAKERQIVCGAKNFQVGDKVPLALPGCTLPTPAGSPPFTIKVGKIRGVDSEGMMCSGKELGLSADADGLLILPAAAPPGQPFAAFLGRQQGDVVFDLEVTPNRPDLNSVIGIAREISALTGSPLRLPQIDLAKTSSQPIADSLQVRVEDPELCPRYTARLVRGVKIGPSPDWLKHCLENVGFRSINNVVDVTNFVLMETGQPLHAFDFHLLSKTPGASSPAIVVRRATPNETFTTLDGQSRSLAPDMLLIADETKPVALAGVMGGLNSEIQPHTVDVLIESAYFKPQNIRATSKRLELRTESSYRFERGADIEICDWASRRAAQLISDLAGGEVLSQTLDFYPRPHQPKEIKLRHARVASLLGLDLAPDENAKFLSRLGLEVIHRDPLGSCVARIPSFRVDLKEEVDLIEEIARLYGVDKIPSRPPRGTLGTHPHDAVHDQLNETRKLLTGLGLVEAQGQTLIARAAAELANPQPVRLQNPLSSDMDALRPSLLPGLLDALRHNSNHKTADSALFEIGRVFSQTPSGAAEHRKAALALTGKRNPPFWTGEARDAKNDIFDLKGIIEEWTDLFGVRGLIFKRRPAPTSFFLESATIHLGKQELGELGQLLPSLAKRYDLRDAVFLAELDLELLMARRTAAKAFKPLPAFPSIRRDVAMLVPEAAAHESVLALVKQSKVPNLEGVELFDVFRGKNVPDGQKSLAYAFTYRHAERTLTDAEVNSAHAKLVEQFKQNLQAVIRE